jgi:hypothetical protein
MRQSGLSGDTEVFKMLRQYDKDLFAELRKKVNSQLAPQLEPIENEINSSLTSSLRSNMRGMFYDGRSGWAGVKIKARVSTRKRELIFLEGKGGNEGLGQQFGFEYAELAGIERRPPRSVSKGWYSTGVGYHSYIYNGQGKAFNRRLTQLYGKPGRFMWIRVLKRKPKVEEKVLQITDSLNIKINRRFG